LVASRHHQHGRAERAQGGVEVGAAERGDAVAASREPVTGLGPERGQQFGGRRPLGEVTRAEQRPKEGRGGPSPIDVGRERRRAVDDRKSGRARRSEEAGAVGLDAPLGHGGGERGEGGQVAGHTALELHRDDDGGRWALGAEEDLGQRALLARVGGVSGPHPGCGPQPASGAASPPSTIPSAQR
jgi:hypothetical protein